MNFVTQDSLRGIESLIVIYFTGACAETPALHSGGLKKAISILSMAPN
jgi:hypothetical protein